MFFFDFFVKEKSIPLYVTPWHIIQCDRSFNASFNSLHRKVPYHNKDQIIPLPKRSEVEAKQNRHQITGNRGKPICHPQEIKFSVSVPSHMIVSPYFCAFISKYIYYINIYRQRQRKKKFASLDLKVTTAKGNAIFIWISELRKEGFLKISVCSIVKT